jgi:hypothetical protein
MGSIGEPLTKSFSISSKPRTCGVGEHLTFGLGGEPSTQGIGEPLTQSFSIGSKPRTCSISEHLTFVSGKL